MFFLCSPQPSLAYWRYVCVLCAPLLGAFNIVDLCLYKKVVKVILVRRKGSCGASLILFHVVFLEREG